MSDLESAEAMVQYYRERPPRLGQRPMIVRFSNYEELKTEPSLKVYSTCWLVLIVFVYFLYIEHSEIVLLDTYNYSS